MEEHRHPFSSPSAPRLPPPTFHRRAPSRSPNRNRLSVTDDIFRDFAPARIFEAFTNPSGRLKASIEAASPTDRAFGLRAAVASRDIQEWVYELEAWDWPDEGGSLGFEVPPAKRRKVSHNGHSQNDGEKVEYIGSLLAPTVSEYESRIDQIHSELDDLNVEEIKKHVLDTHFAPSRPSSSSSNVSSSLLSSYIKMEDFTAIVTATVLKALPNLGRLMRLMDIWSIRLSVLRRVPKLLRRFEEGEVALQSGWVAIRLKQQDQEDGSEEQVLSRDSFEVMRNFLQEQVGTLGRDLDYMLDTLEGREDTLPEAWLDRMESIEQNYGEWAVAGDRKVREGEWAKLAKLRREREEEARRVADQAARLKADQDARDAEAEVQRLEAERKVREADIARLKAEEDVRRADAEARRLREEQEAKEKAARLKAEQEAANARRRVEEAENARLQAEEEARLAKEAKAKADRHVQEELERLKAQEVATAAEATRLKVEEAEKAQILEEHHPRAIVSAIEQQRRSLELESTLPRSVGFVTAAKPENRTAKRQTKVRESQEAFAEDIRTNAHAETQAISPLESEKTPIEVAQLQAVQRRDHFEVKELEHSKAIKDPDAQSARWKALKTAEEGVEVARLRALLHPLTQKGQTSEQPLSNQSAEQPSLDVLKLEPSPIFLESTPSTANTRGLQAQENEGDICHNAPKNVFMSFDRSNDVKAETHVVPLRTKNSSPPILDPVYISKQNANRPPPPNIDVKPLETKESGHVVRDPSNIPLDLNSTPVETNSSPTKLTTTPQATNQKSRMHAVSLESLALAPNPPIQAKDLLQDDIEKQYNASVIVASPFDPPRPSAAPRTTSTSVIYSPETGTFQYVEPPISDSSVVGGQIQDEEGSQREILSTFQEIRPRTGYSTSDATPEILVAEPAHYFRPLISPIKSTRSSVISSDPSTPTSPRAFSDFVASEQASPTVRSFDLPARSPKRLPTSRDPPRSPSRKSPRHNLTSINSVDGAAESTPARDVELDVFQGTSLARKTSITRFNSPSPISVNRRDSTASNSTIVNTVPNSPISPSRRPSSPIRPSTPTFSNASDSFQEDLSPSIRRHRNGKSHDYTSPDSPPPIPILTNRSPISPSAHGSFSSTSRSSESPRTPIFETLEPTPAPITSPRKANSDEQMQQQISTLLESIPARIRLTTETNISPMDSLTVKKTRRPVGPALRPSSTLSNYSRAPTPSFTLAPAHGSTQPRHRPQNGNPEIKVYHLSRSTGEAPIKLFVRLVGENGERVMVRVGGGWADLGEYLKEYASHHGRRAAVGDDDKVEIQDLPPRTVSNSSTATVRDNGRSTPVARPASALSRPLSSLALRKTRKSAGDTLDLPTPTTSFRSPSTPMPSSLSRSFASSSYDTPPSNPASAERSSSRLSWTEEDSSLGLAGPKSKKVVISEKDQEWVESMKEKVRQASAEKERKNRGRESSLGEMDRVGGTKRLFRKG